MESFSRFCCVFVVVMVTVASSKATDEEACSLPLGPSDRSSIISQLLNRCLVESNGTDVKNNIRQDNSIEQLRKVFKNHCQHLDEVRNCIVQITTLSDDCQHETMHENFKIQRDTFKLMLEEGCISDGESIAVLFGGMNEYQRKKKVNFVEDCWNPGTSISEYENTTPVSHRKDLYNHIKKFKECVNSFEFQDKRIQELVRNSSTPILDEVLKKMQCNDPQQLTALQLCETVITS